MTDPDSINEWQGHRGAASGYRHTSVTVDLAWSSRAFNIGLVVGMFGGGIAGTLLAIWLFKTII